MFRTKGKLIALTALIMVFSLFASGCELIEKKPEAIARQNVARVGGEYITRGELDKEFESYLESFKAVTGSDDEFFKSEQGRELVGIYKRNLLNDMVQRKLYKQKAGELKIFKDENELNEEAKKFIEEYKVNNNMTEEDFKKWLDENKITEEEFQEMAKYTVTADKLREYATKDVTVEEDEIKKYYEENKETLTEKPNTMEMSHILVDTEEEAKTVKERLDKGEDFAAVAKEVSKDTASKEKGGNLGEIEYNSTSYDQAFMEAAKALEVGQISEPVLSSFGYHIIKVTKKTEYPVLSYEEAKDTIKNQLLTEKQYSKFTEVVNEWQEEAKIKIYEKNIDNTK